MAKIQILNNVAVTIDGSTVIPKDDIMSITRQGIGQEPVEGRTFGDPFHGIPGKRTKNFSIRIKAEAKSNEIMASLFQEYKNSPKHHLFSIYDGTACTMTYIDCIVYDVSSDLNVDEVVAYDYSISALDVNIAVDGEEN